MPSSHHPADCKRRALPRFPRLAADFPHFPPHSANARHSYAFPRIYAIMNDGKSAYNGDKDGQGQEIGSCSVRALLRVARWRKGEARDADLVPPLTRRLTSGERT